MNKSQELLEIVEELEDLKDKQSQAKGALKEIQKELKTKYGCSSLKEAKTKLAELDDEIYEEQGELDDLIEKLQDDMEAVGL